MIGADIPALVRVQEGPAPIAVERGVAAARRYVLSHLQRRSAEARFALTLYRASDSRCCPQGRTIAVRFGWNGKRLVQTRPLLREGVEPAVLPTASSCRDSAGESSRAP